MFSPVQDQYVFMKGLTQVLFCEMPVVLNREFPMRCFIRNQRERCSSVLT